MNDIKEELLQKAMHARRNKCVSMVNDLAKNWRIKCYQAADEGKCGLSVEIPSFNKHCTPKGCRKIDAKEYAMRALKFIQDDFGLYVRVGEDPSGNNMNIHIGWV